MLGEARRLIAQRDGIEVAAIELLGEHDDFRRLQQVPGIGPIHALIYRPGLVSFEDVD